MACWDVLVFLVFAVLPAAGAPLPALMAEPLGFPLGAACFPWHMEKPWALIRSSWFLTQLE